MPGSVQGARDSRVDGLNVNSTPALLEGGQMVKRHRSLSYCRGLLHVYWQVRVLI